MPRGIPNAKRDETGLRYTTFNVPLAPNPKHVSSTYLKSESQLLWARNAKNKATTTEETPTSTDQRRGSSVIVIHPGSRFIRIGKASDVTPKSVPTVVARKSKPPVPEPVHVEGITRPQKFQGSPANLLKGFKDEYGAITTSDDPFEAKLAAIMLSLRDRMRFYKLRVTPNATNIASTFNAQFEPEKIQEINDPFKIDWIDSSSTIDVLIGEEALRVADPQQSDYIIRWPLYGSNFNTRDYTSLQLILSDIEVIIKRTLEEQLDIGPNDFRNYSVVLVIPDFYDRAYVREMINLLVGMGFKQFCAQQESLAATYGAGISNACVVDIGATITSIACVDEGLVLPDTRMTLSTGGDDITEFLYVLLNRINFPYRSLNLARTYDWRVMEDLKSRLCTLAEGDVALNLYDFVVRQPNQPAEKYGLRAYDEIILAPMCIFEPRVIEFDKKRAGLKPFSLNVTDEIMGLNTDHVTNAMVISTQHLMPPAPESGATAPKNQAPTAEPTLGAATLVQSEIESTAVAAEASTSNPNDVPVDAPVVEPMEVDDDSKNSANDAQPSAQPTPTPTPTQYPGGYAIDVCFEASKLPLDVAIFNSARAAGGDEKIRKYLQAVLVVGGTALTPGMGHALESRLQAIATPLVTNMEKVQIIPPPKEVDPRVLEWKGAAVLGKMDGVSELWVTPADWDILGMRALKERCFFL